MKKYVIPCIGSPTYKNNWNDIQNFPQFAEPSWLPGMNDYKTNLIQYIQNELLQNKGILVNTMDVNNINITDVTLNMNLDYANACYTEIIYNNIYELMKTSYIFITDVEYDTMNASKLLGYFVTNAKLNASTITFTCTMDVWSYICRDHVMNNDKYNFTNVLMNRLSPNKYDITNKYDKNNLRYYNFNIGDNKDNGILNHDSYCTGYTNKYDKMIFKKDPNWKIKYPSNEYYTNSTGFFNYAIFNNVPTTYPNQWKLDYVSVQGVWNQYQWKESFFSRKWNAALLQEPVYDVDIFGPTGSPVLFSHDDRTEVLQYVPYLIVPYQPAISERSVQVYKNIADILVEASSLNMLIGSPFPLTSFIKQQGGSDQETANYGSFTAFGGGSFLNGSYIAPTLVNWPTVNSDASYSNFKILDNIIFRTPALWMETIKTIHDFTIPQSNPHSYFSEHFEYDIYKVKKQSYILNIDNLLYNQPINTIVDNGFDFKAQCYFSTGIVGYYLFAECGLYSSLNLQQNYGLFVSGLYQLPNTTAQWQTFINSNYSTFSANQLNNSLNSFGQTLGDVLIPTRWGQAYNDIFGGGTQQQRLQTAQIQDLKRRPNILNNSSLNDYVIDKMANNYLPYELFCNERKLSNNDLINVSQHFYFNGHPYNNYINYRFDEFYNHFWFDFIQSENIDYYFKDLPLPIFQQVSQIYKTGFRQWYYHIGYNDTYTVMHNKENLEYNVIKDLQDNPITSQLNLKVIGDNFENSITKINEGEKIKFNDNDIISFNGDTEFEYDKDTNINFNSNDFIITESE